MARPTKIFAALMCSAALALTACGSGGGNGSSGSSDASGKGDTSAPLYDKLPADIRDKGTIVVGSSIDYPPFEYYAADGKTLEGFEVELADLLEKQLGVKFDWQNASFDTLFTALRSGRYDIVYGATNDTTERQQQFDMLDYLKSAQGVVVQSGNPQGIHSEDDLCGKSMAYVRGGVQGQILEDLSKKCTGSGKQAITLLPFDGNSGEQLAVKQGQAAGMLENYPTAVTFAKESGGTLELVKGLQLSSRYFAMVVPKDQTQLLDALKQAWQAIMTDGSYKQVLDKWDLGDLAIDKPEVNGAKS